VLRYPTDEELAIAIEKIMTVVRESIADFKAAAPALVQSLSDDEWTKLKRDEDRRRRAMGEIPKQTLAQIRLLSDADLTRLLWFISDHSWQRASRELLPAFIKASRKTKRARHG
jgi:hypothetical protein